MKRLDWTFERRGDDLARAAIGQLAHRKVRLAHWEEEKARVMAEIRESGIDIKESLVAQLANYTNAGFGGRAAAQVTIDPTLLEDLQETLDKIKEHTVAVRDYEAWIEVLQANPGQMLALDQNDWLFFFGGQ